MASEQQSERVRIEIPTLEREIGQFRTRIIGQTEAVSAFAALLAKVRSGVRSQKPGPIDIMFLAGPSGVGKTELVLTFAELLAGEESDPKQDVIKLNGGEYHNQYLVARIVGAPPGYRGSEDPHYPDYKDPALFTQENLDSHRVFYKDRTGREQNTVIILIDEAEKAHESLHRALLSVLDKGQMTTGTNRNSDFSNAIIFFTSNIGNQEVERVGNAQGAPLEREEARRIMHAAFENEFPSEYRGRINKLIIFEHLDEAAIKQIADMNIRRVEKDFAANGIEISIELSTAALTWIINQGYNPTEGARALEKVVNRTVLDRLILIAGDVIHRKKIYADIADGESELSFYFNEGEQLPEFSQAVVSTSNSTEQLIPEKNVIQQSTPNLSVQQRPEVRELVQTPASIEAQPVIGRDPVAVDREIATLFSSEPISREIGVGQLGNQTGKLVNLLAAFPEDGKVTIWWEPVGYKYFDYSRIKRRFVLRWDQFDNGDIAAIALTVNTSNRHYTIDKNGISVFSGTRDPLRVAEFGRIESFVQTDCIASSGNFDHRKYGAGQQKKAENVMRTIQSLSDLEQRELLDELSGFLLHGPQA